MKLRPGKHEQSGKAVIREIVDLENCDEFGRPMLTALVEAPLTGDHQVGLVKELLAEEEWQMLVQLIGRSGHSRMGLHPRFAPGEGIELSGNKLEFMADVISLRWAYRNRFLSVLRNVDKNAHEPLEIGSVMFLPEDSFCSADEVEEGIKSNMLLLPECAEVLEDGVIEIPLSDFFYAFNDGTMRFRDQMNNVILHGKHALSSLQSQRPGLPNTLAQNSFFVGEMRISLGCFDAIIDEQTNEPGVFHLAARLLHAIRTTGMNDARQLEIFNSNPHAIDLKNLKIRVRLLPSSMERQKLARMVVNEKTLQEGVDLSDIIQLQKQPEILMNVMNEVTPHYDPDGTYALLLAGNRAGKVRWDLDVNPEDADQFTGDGSVPEFLNEYTKSRGMAFVAKEPGCYLVGEEIPDRARPLTRVIGSVGKGQDHGKLFISNALPNGDVIQSMKDAGIGAFVCHDVVERPNMYEEQSAEDKAKAPQNYMSFTGPRYKELREYERQGMLFYSVFHETEDQFYEGPGVEIIPSHVRQFFRGLWVRPEYIERYKKVNTVLAMYGTHKEAVKETLTDDMKSFMKRLKGIFGDTLAITHGNGPGVMQLADKCAQEEDILTIGVGIDVEKFDQPPNNCPHAQIGFVDRDRLDRQQIMDNLANIKVFNVGGGGTLEEVAITICSQKLRKNVIAPIFFVDTTANPMSRDHLWKKLIEQIHILAEDQKVTPDEAASTVQYLQKYAANFCNLVHSYDEVADKLEEFVEDPIEYYQEIGLPDEHIRESYEIGLQTHELTEFDMPDYARNKIRPYVEAMPN